MKKLNFLLNFSKVLNFFSYVLLHRLYGILEVFCGGTKW